MSAPSASLALERIHRALQLPLYERCRELQFILEECSTKDLHAILPVLTENIFGFSNTQGWGLKSISLSWQPSDFKMLRHFLSPQGPMIRMVYRLLLENIYKFEFPLQCIPWPSRRLVDEGATPVLYINKLQFTNSGQPAEFLLLNAFEYFIFHLTYYLVNPQHQRINSYNWNNTNETLYIMLVEDYMNYFLPAEGNGLPPISALSMQQQLGTSNTPRTFFNNFHMSPFRAAGGSRDSSPFSLRSFISHSPQAKATPTGHMTNGEQQTELWRSETFLQIVTEVWLNQNSLDMMHRRPFSPTCVTANTVSENFLPSQDHVKVVRMLVKYLHYFSGSGRPDITSPGHHCHVGSWSHFKKSAVNQIVQKKLYSFLKHAFLRWPLDYSFRLVLETWLSYIQPWRYQGAGGSPTHGKEGGGGDRTVNQQWQLFVTDNLLYFTVMFQAFLPRVFRTDLSCPRNAYMLFRVTKVFSQTNLNIMIQQAEGALCDASHSLRHGGYSPGYLGSPVAAGHAGTAAALRMQFSELEGHGFQYQPLFSPECSDMIQQLLDNIQQARAANEQAAVAYQKSQNQSWLTWLFSDNGYYDDFSPNEAKRTDVHLAHAAEHLCTMFNVENDSARHRRVAWGSSTVENAPSTPGRSGALYPDCIYGQQGAQLTPLGRHQLMNGLRRFDITFRGDPDLQPIRSFECAALVRQLHRLATSINSKYGLEIARLYESEEFSARVAKQFLLPPTSAATLHPGSPPPLQALPARLSMRYLGSYRSMGYAGVLALAAYVWGLGPVTYALLLVFLALCYGVVGAIVTRSVTRAKQQ
ncbi:PREDICTED: sphingomyelin phosphodiesterase 4-like isoform X2 [Priapulus caudatus]|uniref:Sphingomyelin phosphodiesterase 4-like isoform X2 n=1 Tax=Priapulus caudatus TaxID=37621 RepID=A0ABM1E397_PRICU|nr:PREDICTED: sphingomyelin phosphodiesterase 4-like isoform X2 [Priapulus caudatus]